jgi:glycosyltransferase involved in cell wall biosynthesis
VVHAHWLPIGRLALLYGASPLVVSAWGSDVFRASRREKLAGRVVARSADAILASSEALRSGMVELGAAPERTAVINWGVDLEAFVPPDGARDEVRAALGLPSGPLILSPRSSGEVYNADVIVRAFDRLADERNEVSLVLLRATDGRVDLKGVRHADRVRLIDRVPADCMPDYYRAADVCVSIASSDSSPRSVWEAMACGTPCVLSDIPWVHELIVDGAHALVVPIDERRVGVALRRLLDDAALADRIVADARHLVKEHRDRNREMDRLCTIYQRVVEEGGRHARLRSGLGPVMGALGTALAVGRRACSYRRWRSSTQPS